LAKPKAQILSIAKNHSSTKKAALFNMTGNPVTVLKFTIKNYLKNLVKILDTPAHEGERSNSVYVTEILLFGGLGLQTLLFR